MSLLIVKYSRSYPHVFERLSSSHSMHNVPLSLLLFLYLIVSMEYVGYMCRQTIPGQDGRRRKRGNAILIEKCAATTANACFSSVNATISSTVSTVPTSAVAVRASLSGIHSLSFFFYLYSIRLLHVYTCTCCHISRYLFEIAYEIAFRSKDLTFFLTKYAGLSKDASMERREKRYSTRVSLKKKTKREKKKKRK